MKKKLLNITLLILSTSLSGLLVGCGGGGGDGKTKCAGQTQTDDTSCITLDNRDVIVYKPKDTIKGIALFLHGAPGTPKKVSSIFNAKSISDTQQLISVSPQGSTDFWGWNSVNDKDNVTNNDVDFVVNLLTKLRAENNITSDKVYIFGYSAGGFMGYKLACQIPEQITAFVSLAGQFRGDFSQCSTSTPITLHHFHSPQDGDVPMLGRDVGDIQSVAETLAHWRLINGCSEIFTTLEHPKLTNNSKGTKTQIWQDCVKDVSFSEMNNVPHEASYNAEALKQIYAPIFK